VRYVVPSLLTVAVVLAVLGVIRARRLL